MANKRLIVGNWKMNPSRLEEAQKIARKTRNAAAKLRKTEAVICPPFVFIPDCVPKNKASRFSVGAQSVSTEEAGPHTGEVGAKMLREVGVSYVIVGHSEERAKGESDETVSQKTLRVLQAGLTPIVCVGEKERDEAGAYLESLKEQIKRSLANIPQKENRDIVLAYEPIWAIGAKEAMTPPLIQEMSLFVKKTFADVFGPDAGLKVKVLYGGAVNYRNAADIIAIGKVDGLLVGRESVNVTGFVELLKTVDAV